MTEVLLSERARDRLGDLGDESGFFVADDGEGIPESDYDAVFQAGYSSTTEGTGFGLKIVRDTVEAHGWEIRVTDSTEGGRPVRDHEGQLFWHIKSL